MNKGNHLVFTDNKNDLWEFYLSDDNVLMYSATSNNNKMKEDGRIDINVLGFAADIDKKGTVHFAYIKKNALEYCKLDNGLWSSKTIHRFKYDNCAIKELSLHLTGKNVNIFYVLQKDIHKNTGTICHLLWDGQTPSIDVINNINLLPYGRTNFMTEALDNEDILLLFVSNNEKEVLFKSCIYSNNVFSNVGLLYALKGNSMDFHMVKFGKEYHILNLSHNGQNYLLEVISIESPGKVKSITKIHQSNNEIQDSLLLVDDDTLWAFWKTGNRLFYSIFSGWWSKAFELNIRSGITLDTFYNIYKTNSGEYRMRRLLGTYDPEFRQILPGKLFTNREKDNIPKDQQTAINNIPDSNEVTSGKQEVVPLPSARNHVNYRKSLREIMECSIKEWQKAFNRKNCTSNAKSCDMFTPTSISPHSKTDYRWSKEMFENSAILAREKIGLEKKYNKLAHENLSLQQEISELKILFDEEKSSCNILNEKINKLEAVIKNLINENELLKEDLETEKSKGILEFIFKKSKAVTRI